MRASVLVIDDEPDICHFVSEALGRYDCQTEVASGGVEGLARCLEFCPDLAFVDVNLGDMDGLEVVEGLLRQKSDLVVVVMSGHSSIDLAVEAMKRGAYHYIAKPFGVSEIRTLVDKALADHALKREVETFRREQERNATRAINSMVGVSRPMQDLKALLAKIAMSPATTVLIQGETGTGKEVAARALHFMSDRRDGPFIALNCSAIPEHLLENELFGHEKGAFTDAKSSKTGLIEQAAGGTFFLDEIGDMSVGLQAKILRTLQERTLRRVGGSRDIPVNVRVVAATHRDLKKTVAEGKFREDLFYRLQVVPILLPPLRARLDDIEPLLNYFIAQFCEEFRRPPIIVTKENLEELKRYAWPGNVREMRNWVERAMLLGSDRIEPHAEHARLDTSSTPEDAASTTASAAVPGAAQANGQWVIRVEEPSLANVEKEIIYQVLEHCSGNKIQAAQMLGINRTTLYRKLSQYEGTESDTDGAQEASS